MRYTYSDYLTWDDDQRWELIDGVPFMMSAPSRLHQEISGNLFGELYILLKGKPCRVYSAPFDVRLNADTFDNTVVQPDVIVICNKDVLDKAGCKGPPDLVIEVLSQSTSSRDKKLKFEKYREAKIKEYWIADPNAKTVSVSILENGDYSTRVYGEKDMLPIHMLENSEIDLKEVFMN